MELKEDCCSFEMEVRERLVILGVNIWEYIFEGEFKVERFVYWLRFK